MVRSDANSERLFAVMQDARCLPCSCLLDRSLDRGGASCRFPTRPLLLLRSPQVSAQSSNSETSAAGDIALAAASQRGSHVDPDDVIKAVKSTTRLQVKSLSDGTALRVTFACMSGPCHL